MRLETYHRGCCVVIRIVTPPIGGHVTTTIVEDGEGTVTMLQLAHPPEEAVVPISETLRRDSVYLLKEPLFKMVYEWTIGGLYTLRIDHISDMMLLSEEDELFPARWCEASGFDRQQQACSNAREQGCRKQELGRGREAVSVNVPNCCKRTLRADFL
jgi:hypothetical protein